MLRKDKAELKFLLYQKLADDDFVDLLKKVSKKNNFDYVTFANDFYIKNSKYKTLEYSYKKSISFLRSKNDQLLLILLIYLILKKEL